MGTLISLERRISKLTNVGWCVGRGNGETRTGFLVVIDADGYYTSSVDN